jgi:integral membrane protein (TIGR01906 family)
LKALGILARWIFIISLPVLFFTASIAWGFNSFWLYQYGFQKYEVSQTTGLPENELNNAARGLISYFNSGEEYVHITVTANGNSFQLFNEEEQVHFQDVKQLVWLDYKVLLVTLCIVLGYFLTLILWRWGRYWHLLARTVIWGSGFSLALLLILGIASVLNFDQLFLSFHYLVFTNLTWSASGYMLLLFPGGFWYNAALICITFMAGLAIMFGAAAIAFIRFTRRGIRLQKIKADQEDTSF